jgi:hypothetical protein
VFTLDICTSVQNWVDENATDNLVSDDEPGASRCPTFVKVSSATSTFGEFQFHQVVESLMTQTANIVIKLLNQSPPHI